MNDLNRRPAARTKNATPNDVSGVLETLAAGFSLVLARPYLFILPLLVDLWAWLGVQIYPTALIEPLQELMTDQGGTNGPAAAEELGRIGESLRVNDVIASLTPSIFSGLSNETLLGLMLGVLAPALTSGVDRANVYDDWGQGLGQSVTPDSGFGVLGLGLLLFIGATLLIVLFKVPIAHAVRGGGMSPGVFFRDIALGWLRVVTLVGIVLGGILIVGLPVIITAQVLTLVGINLIAVLSLALFVAGSMGALYTFFLLDAMFIYRVGPIRAAKMSYAVARLNFPQCWRFAAASLLIATGLLHVWGVIVENPPGIIIALIVNAILGTGLSIASMMFFHDRARLPRPLATSRPFTLPRRT
ncbi:MAG: hypothetical protein WKF63_00480 [Thermomicrobiales bacterium]